MRKKEEKKTEVTECLHIFIVTKSGGPMLSVTGINRFYYLRGFTDMRCKHSRVLSVIREQLHREPSDGDFLPGFLTVAEIF